MSKAGKTAEPSMEEILSSIRKIIAEEPMPAVSPAAQKAAIDDVLELADSAPSTEIASSEDGASATSPVPSWLFPTANAGAMAPSEASFKGPLDAPRDLPKPFFPAAILTPEPKMPAVAASARVGTNGVHPRSTTEGKTSDDLGAVVPRRSPAPGGSPVAGVTERRTPQAGLPDWLSRATGGAKPAAAPQPIGAPAEPTRIAPRDDEAAVPSLSELAKPSFAAADSSGTMAEQTTTPMVATDVVSPSPETGIVATETVASAMIGSDVSLPSTVPKPTLLGERLRSPKANGAMEAVPTVAQSGAVRTLDDTIIDLLRPMIRQWLDDNMPRMVEKALRVELAASVKPKADQSKH